MEIVLPPGFYVRHPSLDDLSAIVRVIAAYELATDGELGTTEEDVQSEWNKARFNIQEDAWVVVAPAEDSHPERVVGYQELWNRSDHCSLAGDGYVDPHFNGMGIGTTLLRLVDARARQHLELAEPGRRVFIRNGLSGVDKAAYTLHENEGYRPVRYFWHMEIMMDQSPSDPVWPDGIFVRNFLPGIDEHRVFDSFEDAFRDHWGYSPWNYEDWARRRLNDGDFDPSLCFIALDGDQIVGGALCTYRQENGWVSQLAVRRPWRRRGLGQALLMRTFQEFYHRGAKVVRLGVDANSPTGANRLYQRCGMHMIHEYVVYEKELRPGD